MITQEEILAMPKTRKEAVRLKENKYNDGKPCLLGHIYWKYVKEGCAACHSLRVMESRKRRDKKPVVKEELPDGMVDTQEALKILGYTPHKLKTLIDNGQFIECVGRTKHRRSKIYNRAQLDAWIENTIRIHDRGSFALNLANSFIRGAKLCA